MSHNEKLHLSPCVTPASAFLPSISPPHPLTLCSTKQSLVPKVSNIFPSSSSAPSLCWEVFLCTFCLSALCFLVDVTSESWSQHVFPVLFPSDQAVTLLQPVVNCYRSVLPDTKGLKLLAPGHLFYWFHMEWTRFGVS